MVSRACPRCQSGATRALWTFWTVEVPPQRCLLLRSILESFTQNSYEQTGENMSFLDIRTLPGGMVGGIRGWTYLWRNNTFRIHLARRIGSAFLDRCGVEHESVFSIEQSGAGENVELEVGCRGWCVFDFEGRPAPRRGPLGAVTGRVLRPLTSPGYGLG